MLTAMLTAQGSSPSGATAHLPALGNQATPLPRRSPTAMKVGNVNINVSDLAEQIKNRPGQSPKHGQSNKKPNCTHINMDRVYGRNQNCYVCGREPSIGFLYVCRQDFKTPTDLGLWEVEGVKPEDKAGPNSDLRRELEEVGLSEYLIVAAERGEYTASQLQTIKAQKLHLRRAIEDVIQGRQMIALHAKMQAAVEEFRSAANALPNHDGAGSSHERHENPEPLCTFRACHTCRPYYKDRLYTSFDDIISFSLPPVTESDIARLSLPTKSATVLKTIGLRQNPLPFVTSCESSRPKTSRGNDADSATVTTSRFSSVLTFSTTKSDLSALSRMRVPRKRFYNLGDRTSQDFDSASRSDVDMCLSGQKCWRSGFKNAIHGMLKLPRDSSSEGSMITLPAPFASEKNNSTEKGAGMGIGCKNTITKAKTKHKIYTLDNDTLTPGGKHHRTKSHKSKSASKSSGISLPSHPRSHDSEDNTSATSTASDLTTYTCPSDAGSEVEVEGGVALTEEAVETHTPDILNMEEAEEAVMVQV